MAAEQVCYRPLRTPVGEPVDRPDEARRPVFFTLNSSLDDARTIEQALADLREKYANSRDLNSARMIRQLETEVAIRKRLMKREA